jgi:hypothetical protein
MPLSRRDLLASSAALAATAGVAAGALPQTEAAQDEELSPEAALLKKLQGGWALRELDVPNLDENGRKEKAFMVIGGNFLAIELQLSWDAHVDDEWVDGFFQSGVSRIWLERSKVLVAKSLIGVTTGENYGLEIEPPGKERRYRVHFFGKNELELAMVDGPRFLFKRLLNGDPRRKTSKRSTKDL